MAHNYGTNVKINIFGTYPVKSENVDRKKNIPKICLSMTASTNIIIYFYSKIRTVQEVVNFLTKTRTIFSDTVLHYHTYHKIKFLSHFRNKYSFCNIIFNY